MSWTFSFLQPHSLHSEGRSPLWTEANPPLYALELILCICYVSLFGWWFILSCILIFSLIYLSSTIYQYTEAHFSSCESENKIRGVFPLLKNSNLLSGISKLLLQTGFSTSMPIFLFNLLCYAFSLSYSTRTALENDLLFAHLKRLSSVLIWFLGSSGCCWNAFLKLPLPLAPRIVVSLVFPPSLILFSYLK